MKLRATLTALLLAFSLGCKPHANLTPAVKSPIESQHAATHRIGLTSVINAIDELGKNAHCSATAVAPHALLTAAHCVTNTNLVYLDKEKSPTYIVAELPDGADHIIYIVQRTFTDFMPMVERPMVKEEPVHFWGNPGHSRDVYRDGFFKDMLYEPDFKYTFQHFMLPTFGGDSGSGVMDAEGNVVAVISLADTSSEEMSLPLAFSEDQLTVAGVKFTVTHTPSTFEQFLDMYFSKRI